MNTVDSESKIIGPFLGPRGKNGVEIFIALPDQPQITELTCSLSENGNEVDSRDFKTDENNVFRLFRFSFDSLDDQKTYSYRFLSGGEPLDLEGDLTTNDCTFKVLGEDSESKSFILMSCHNPFQTQKGSADEGWTVWKQLAEHLEKDKSVHLLVLGGDQIYNDEIETEFLSKLKNEDKDLDKLRKRFIKQYQKFWGELSYRKVLASTLSVAMWDDHDITDGWGSRPESFDSSAGFKKNWQRFFEVAKEAFVAYQASRNPEPIHSLSSILDWGDTKFVLADFRSERNSEKDQLWTDEHKNSVFGQLTDLPETTRRVFFVSPVVALRTNFSEDKRLGIFSRWLFDYRKFSKNNKFGKWLLGNTALIIGILLFLSPYFAIAYSVACSMLLQFLWTTPATACAIHHVISPILLQLLGITIVILWAIPHIPHLPDLSDDLEDGLSSPSNMESLKEILEVLTGLARRGKSVYILSGDIHLGGLTEIVDAREDPKAQILQVVSSPIAYKPMPKEIAGITTTTSEMKIEKQLFARNIFYISKRNFAQIFPNRKENFVSFHLESHKFPISFPNKFYPPTDTTG